MVDSGTLFAILDEDGMLRFWSAEFETYFNLAGKREVLFCPLFHKECRKEIRDNLESVVASKRVKSFFIQSDGNAYSIQFRPLRNRSSNACLIAVYVDFAEKAYSKYTADILETVLDTTSDPIVLFDSKGTILLANYLVPEVMMIQDVKESLVGKNIMEIFPPEYRDSRRAH